jgi:hypothetical protein
MYFSALSQTDPVPLARYTFNNGQAKNELSAIQPKISGATFVEDRFGNNNNAIYLHGNSSSYINLGTDNSLKPKSGSISMWINIELIMQKGKGWDYNPILLTKSHSGDDFYEGYFIGLNFHTNKLNVTTSRDSANQLTLNSHKSLSLRQWHHIVMTYDDHHLALYLDNNLEAKLPKKFSNVFLAGDSIMIGNSANVKNERYLCGSLDDIEIYDKVLSPEDVSDLYNATNPNRFKVYLNWFLKIILVILLFIAFAWIIISRYKIKIKKEQEKNDLQAMLNELETKAIRTQMNPHFIFNSLNTLQRFILEQDFENSHVYLTKFSRLLRKLLESSTAESITLEEEINILNNYIELEHLRFDDTFDFEVICNVPEPSNIHLPFMLVQPFVENAIWHGLMPKKGDRKLTITFNPLDELRIACIIEDNGVGSNTKSSNNNPLKKKSLAIEFIRQRLDLIEKSKGIKCYLKITDKRNDKNGNTGTIVEVIIPKMNNI